MKLDSKTILFSRSFFLTKEELKSVKKDKKLDDVYVSHASALGLDVANGKKGIFMPFDTKKLSNELEKGSKAWLAEVFVFTRAELDELINRAVRGEVLFDKEEDDAS